MPREEAAAGGDRGVKITETTVFLGASVHAPVPSIRLVLDLGWLHDRMPASLGDHFVRNVKALLPGLDARCGEGAQDLFEDRGRGFARLLAAIALDLQNQLGAQCRYCRVDAQGVRCQVFYELWDPGVARPAAQLALDLLLRLVGASDSQTGTGAWNAGAERELLLKRLRPHALDLITMAMVREAAKRGIPWYRLVPGKPFVQLGQGSRQKHVRESASVHTSSTGRYLSKDKNATNALLARIGVPVPAQRLVTTAEEAIEAAATLGFPVVTKPLDRGNGKGVSVGLRHPDAVRWGFGEAAKYGEEVIVERFVAGDDHRILVIDGRMVAAAKRIPGHVVGDGERTIAQLVEATNADPRRGTEYDQVMVRLEFDAQAEQVLTEAGLGRDSVPARGQVVPLRRTANVSTGGTCEDVTDSVHPDNRDAALRASRVLGLNVAGVDFLSTDISRSYREIGGGICEVNFSPGLRPHWNADPGRDVVGPIMDTLFAPGATGRIPVAAAMGGAQASETCRVLARLLSGTGHCTGLASREGVQIDGRLARPADRAGPDAASTLLFDPSVDACVLECRAAAVLADGLAVDAFDAAAVLRCDGPEDHWTAPARVLVQSARDVILNADDSGCLELRAGIAPDRLVLISQRPAAAVEAHIAGGGRAVILSGDKDLALELHARNAPAQTLETTAKAGTTGVALGAAVALAWSLGLEIDRIRGVLPSVAE